jgi:predicted alpha/beta superfamily hydrolase
MRILGLLFFSFCQLVAQNPPWPQRPGVHFFRDIQIEDLNRSRSIWVYLPPDYREEANKSYSVIYMQDGQNLFEDSSSYAGEWHIDEQLDELAARGLEVPIVVAPENGQALRVHEYSPWSGKYGGGEGELFARFMKEQLIPLIDSIYPTIAKREARWLMGSSLGALISTFTFLSYPETFAGSLAFSPAYWYNPQIHQMAKNFQGKHDYLLYHIAGLEEDSGDVEKQIVKLETALFSQNQDIQNSIHLIHSYGKHQEWYWAESFSACWETVLYFQEHLGDASNTSDTIQAVEINCTTSKERAFHGRKRGGVINLFKACGENIILPEPK